MPRKGKRKLVHQDIPNIYADDSRCYVIVKIRDAKAGKSKPKELRFALGTPIEDLIDARDRLQRRAKASAKPQPGTLQADAVDYLKTISEKRKHANAVTYCAHWTIVMSEDGEHRYGELSRFALTKLRIEQIAASWLLDGVAASSVKKRLSALSAIFEKTNTDDQINPVLKVKRPKEPDEEPRGQDFEVIARILGKMSDRGRGEKDGPRPTVSLTKLRMTFWAYSGIPPAQIMRIVPATDFLDGDDPVLRARPRRKGKGTKESWLPLQPEAADALRRLMTVGGVRESGELARFDPRSFRYTWRRACEKVIKEQIAAGETPLPHRVVTVTGRPRYVTTTRPYDLRHSYASHALKTSNGNLAGVQELLQHSTPRQTTRYIGAAVPLAAAQAAQAMRGTFTKAKPDGTENRNS